MLRAWTKDYFTSSLPWQQRGTAPALPISGITHAVFRSDAVTQSAGNTPAGLFASTAGAPDHTINVNNLNGRSNILNALQKNDVDLSNATTFNVSDLRLAFQIQKWMERNARAGARYTEFLKAHYGVSPRDERLQRPEYVGGSKSPVIVSEVLQTSAVTGQPTPQGNMAGHGISADKTFVGKYHAQEFGLMMGIMSVMPKPAYQQGIDRQWLRRSRYDFYSPEFANLSEQAIELGEIYAQATGNRSIFGYQGRFDEMRVKNNQVVGLMRTDFNYWHLGRIFTAAPAP